MGKLFCIIGKFASGKDTVCNIIKNKMPHLTHFVGYSSMPSDTPEDASYRFVSQDEINKIKTQNKIICSRTKENGGDMWESVIVDDGTVDFSKGSYVSIRDPFEVQSLKDYYGSDKVVTIMLTVNDGIRMIRAISREMTKVTPNYKAVCEKFLDDEKDFDNIVPDYAFLNENVFECVDEIQKTIRKERKNNAVGREPPAK